MTEVKAGFNNMRSLTSHTVGPNYTCSCSCSQVCANLGTTTVVLGIVGCFAATHTFKNSKQLWEKMVCLPQNDEGWHELACIKGLHQRCGFKLFPIYPKEASDQNPQLVAWCCFEKVFVGQTRNGKCKEVIQLESKLTSSKEFLLYAIPKVKDFIIHNFIACWQDKEYKKCVPHLREGEMVSLVDHAKNYSFK
jgi:hypothetical protein